MKITGVLTTTIDGKCTSGPSSLERIKILTKVTKNIMKPPAERHIYSGACIQINGTVFTIHEVAEMHRVQPKLNANTMISSEEQFNNLKGKATPETVAMTQKLPTSIVRKHGMQIFSDEQEEELTKFVRDASDHYNGMSSKDVRVLAFVYGMCNQVHLPAAWLDKHEASFAWCSRFTKRNKLRLSITSD